MVRQLIRQAEQAGVKLSLDRQGRLLAVYSAPVPEDVLRSLRIHREALEAVLGPPAPQDQEPPALRWNGGTRKGRQAALRAH